MAAKGLGNLSRSLYTLRSLAFSTQDPLLKCLAPRLSRTMATEVPIPPEASALYEGMPIPFSQETGTNYEPASTVLTTLYRFPTMEPLRFLTYPSKHLHLPLRRDILHRAIIYEGDATRQGTASSKTRYEVHGSHRKIRPQKGSGMARLGSKQSPMLKGGGKTFGPHPRDFSTKLPRKMYDIAWRTALSWRYRKGDLIVCEDGLDLKYEQERFLRQVWAHNAWGRGNGRTTVVALGEKRNLWKAIEGAGKEGRALTVGEVDVKDLLETGRLVVEKAALDEMLRLHESDLVSKIRMIE